MNNNLINIIIDNDGGTDDFVAIMYAYLSKRFNVKLISLVAGNTDISNVAKNNFKALEICNINDYKICIPKTINKNIINDGAQGENGLGNIKFELDKNFKIENDNAENLILNTINKNTYIIAIGPLTNIANIIKNDPTFPKKCKGIIIMGADEYGGNITPYAEFNIYQDPDAAKTVFNANFDEINIIGFNITKQITFGPEIEAFLKTNNKLSKFLYDITRTTAKLDRGKNKTDGASMNDINTLIYLSHPEYYKTKYVNVTVNTENNEYKGQTKFTNVNKSNIKLVTDVNHEKILKEMLITIFPDKINEINNLLNQRSSRIETIKSINKITDEITKDRLINLLNSEEAINCNNIDIFKEIIKTHK